MNFLETIDEDYSEVNYHEAKIVEDINCQRSQWNQVRWLPFWRSYYFSGRQYIKFCWFYWTWKVWLDHWKLFVNLVNCMNSEYKGKRFSSWFVYSIHELQVWKKGQGVEAFKKLSLHDIEDSRSQMITRKWGFFFFFFQQEESGIEYKASFFLLNNFDIFM